MSTSDFPCPQSPTGKAASYTCRGSVEFSGSQHVIPKPAAASLQNLLEKQILWPLPRLGGSDGKESACNAADLGLSWEDSLERAWQRTPVFLPEESHGQGNLAGYSAWGRKVRHDWGSNALTFTPGWPNQKLRG